jgi:hypothetical protein
VDEHSKRILRSARQIFRLRAAIFGLYTSTTQSSSGTTFAGLQHAETPHTLLFGSRYTFDLFCLKQSTHRYFWFSSVAARLRSCLRLLVELIRTQRLDTI